MTRYCRGVCWCCSEVSLLFWYTYLSAFNFFYKGVLLYLREEFNELPTSINKGYLKCYKNRVKCKLLEIQSKGDDNEWVPENFSINYIPGLRKSERK